MKQYNVVITGQTPLLLHHDNIEWADMMEEWKNDPKNKKKSKAGDDRTPAFRWLGCLYHNGNILAIPQENIMRTLMGGGAMVPVPGGRSGKTFKAQTQSGMQSVELYWPLTTRGKEIEIGLLEELQSVEAFSEHKAFVKSLGFDLMVKRAKVGQSKHIRVRPIFHSWELQGSLYVTDEQITQEILENIMHYAGAYKGLGDWNPGGKTPGPYGQFTATVTEES